MFGKGRNKNGKKKTPGSRKWPDPRPKRRKAAHKKEKVAPDTNIFLSVFKSEKTEPLAGKVLDTIGRRDRSVYLNEVGKEFRKGRCARPKMVK